jgi:DNA-binding response OmpR family regulator
MAAFYRVLVAEDEADIRFMTCFTLRYGGFEVIEAMDGAQALELAQQTVPDLILLDVKMPRLDGIETCRQMKALPAIQHVPVVFMSALGQEQEVARGKDAGALDYLLKPYVPDELIRRVRSILESQR